ncbi:MAG: DUF3450 domain-containing protein [Candidatus Krumholzibacteria bacterium]|nr:DUF3450 domain-containing protein [Candidatus Krumholzibacteria bacterium]
MHLRKHLLAAGVMSILLAGWLAASSAQTEGQNSAQNARQDTEQAIDTRQGTQQRQDEWSEEKADLVRRFRSATAGVKWLGERKAEETAQAQALDDRVAELERRLDEADRLEGSMQDTLMVIFHRLEESVVAGLPFLPEERNLRLASVQDELVRPDVTSAEKLRRLLEALQVEAGYASNVEVYQDMIEIDGEQIHADVLRIGRVALFWRTPDGDRVGNFDPAVDRWIELPGRAKRRIGLAMEMASKMRPMELIDLPLGRIGQ